MNDFTLRAQEALALAHKEADQLNHQFVGTEHLLIGLVSLEQGVGVTVLKKLGVDLDGIREEVKKLIGAGPNFRTIGNPPYTPRLKKVLSLAAKEAQELGHTYIGTEHLLLGLLRDGDGFAAQVLKKNRINIERTREEVLREIGSQVGIQRFQFRKDISTVSGNEFSLRSFTPRAQQVLALARKETERLNHSFVGPEHLLLVLLKLGLGTAFNMLREAGLNLDNVRVEVANLIRPGPDETKHENIPYSPLVKKALAAASREAKALGHTYVGTEHILLGFLGEREGGAARVFDKMNVDVEQLRERILRELGRSPLENPIQMRSNWTPRAHQALVLAHKAAEQLGHKYIGTEHLLLGLTNLGQGTAVNVLQRIGLDLQTIRTEVGRSIGSGLDHVQGFGPYNAGANEVFSLAATEAQALNHSYVGTEHILLGLLREGDGVAGWVLLNLGVDIERTRQEILKELDPNFGAQEI